MTTDDLVAEVRSLIKDNSFSEDTILHYLDKGYKTLADKLLLPWLVVTAEIITVIDAYEVDMPIDYDRNLFAAATPDNELSVYTGVKAVIDAVGNTDLNFDETGTLRAVCESNGKLIYQSVPSDPIVISLQYYSKPVSLSTSGGDEWTSDDFEEALVNYACWKIFNVIEDATDGPKANTKAHKDDYNDNRKEVALYCVRAGENYVTVAPSANKTW